MMRRAPNFRRSLIASCLVVATNAVDDDLHHPARWLSRRDFVFDTTTADPKRNESDANQVSEIKEVEFGQHVNHQVVHRKNNRPGARIKEKELKRKRKLKKVPSNHHHSHNNKKEHRNHHSNLRGKHEHDHHDNGKNGSKQVLNIDADFMGHILRKAKPKSMDYQDGKNKKPTPKPTIKPSKQPTSTPFSDTGGRINTSIPTMPATMFPVAPVTDDANNNDLSKPTSTSLCPSNLRDSEILLEDLTLYYEIIGDNLCMRLEYDNEGWLGLGFSPDGRMVGSTAIIGLPDAQETKANPAYYALNGMVESMVTPLPESQQTLKEAAIVQEDGLTVLTFAKSMIDDEHITMGENAFIFAAANSNQFGYHDKRGAFTLNLSP